jgi:hypothetical protein
MGLQIDKNLPWGASTGKVRQAASHGMHHSRPLRRFEAVDATFGSNFKTRISRPWPFASPALPRPRNEFTWRWVEVLYQGRTVSGIAPIFDLARPWSSPMSFWIYIAGYVIFIAGLATAAHLLNVPMQWICVIVLCMVGVAIVHAVTATRQKDVSS